MRKVTLYPGEDGFWVVEYPSLPGCISQGKTKTEARANIREPSKGYEAALEDTESDPKFIELMERSGEDIRAGRVYAHKEVERRVRERKKGR